MPFYPIKVNGFVFLFSLDSILWVVRIPFIVFRLPCPYDILYFILSQYYWDDFFRGLPYSDLMIEHGDIRLPFPTSRGIPFPLGNTKNADGFNFAIVCRHVQSLTLCLFSNENRTKPQYEITLDPQQHKTGDVWHISIQQLPPDFLYMYRVDEETTYLLDPYAKEVRSTNCWGANGENYFPLGGLQIGESFNWEEDRPLKIPIEDLIIYEMHTRGFTIHKSSDVSHPGTFLGIIEQIPYLLDLGINAIELLPVFEFNETEIQKCSVKTKKELFNYWGYSTVNFFAPMQRYASSDTPGAAISEFKAMVKALHQNGIEVILDIVFNHTAEGNHEGPSYSFKGLDEDIYYMKDVSGNYLNFSGCGNTFNCNHPIVRELILSSLRYWVSEMHVDGFRFDLTSILGRGTKGEPLENPPLLEAISEDPLLSETKLIAEPWDAGGLYQVGSFYRRSGRWSEWNGRYRDILRRFIKGTERKGAFVTNICGSEDLYHQFSPCRSINFVIAHDGFSLADLVSYNQKHNLANSENNQDGSNQNDSWNCGAEGGTHNKKILHLRARQMRNFHLALMISRGVPMIMMGDEYAHTKNGNNNPWCHDNELNWFLWDELKKNHNFYRFYKNMIRFRKQHPMLRRNKFFTSSEIDWHGYELSKPLWDKEEHFIAFTLKDPTNGHDLYLAFNAGSKSATIELPKKKENRSWHWIVNTANLSPYDFFEEESAPLVTKPSYTMVPYSALMLKTF